MTLSVSINGGLKLQLQIEDWVQENLFFLGEYEPLELAWIRQTLGENDCFVDIGAHIGLYSLTAAQKVGKNGKVYSFEPFENNHRALQYHILLNNLIQIQAYPLAISDKKEVLELVLNSTEKNTGMPSAFLSEGDIRNQVEAISLDEFFRQYPPIKVSIIKIDIEGGELHALRGMQNILHQFRPKILMEINPNPPYPMTELLTFLEKHQYQIFKLLQDLTLSPCSTPEEGIFNYILLPVS